MARYLLGWHCHPACTSPPQALDGWHVIGFQSEWLRLSGLGPAPAHSYRMCMLDVFRTGGTAKAKSNRLTLSPLPRTSQAH